MACAQRRLRRRDARRLVDVEPEAVAGAVKKALHAAGDFSRRKTALGEEIENSLVDVSSAHAVFDIAVSDLLSGLKGRVGGLQALGGAAAHDRAAQIAEVAGLLRAWKNIEDHRAV